MGEHFLLVALDRRRGQRRGDAGRVQLDDRPPDAADVTIDDAPALSTTDRTPTFAFSSTDPAAVFQCSLDGAPFAVCESPETYTELQLFEGATGQIAGTHTFAVQALKQHLLGRAARGRVGVDDRGPRRARDDDRLRPARPGAARRRPPSSSSRATSSTRASSAPSTRSSCRSSAPAPAAAPNDNFLAARPRARPAHDPRARDRPEPERRPDAGVLQLDGPRAADHDDHLRPGRAARSPRRRARRSRSRPTRRA